MKKKLTLRLEDSVIDQAKEYAQFNDLSLSQLTESLFLEQLSFSSKSSNNPKSVVSRYANLLGRLIADEKTEIEDYLINKHLK